MRQYAISSWKQEDGLPLNTAFAVTQTPDGDVWIATDAGLARFDGTTFVDFGKTAHSAFVGTVTYALLVDNHGTLWIGTGGNGVHRYRAGAFERAPHFAAGTSVNALNRAHGRIWAATSTGLMAVPVERTASPVTWLRGRFVRSLAAGAHGRMWAGTAGNGVWLIANGRESQLPALEAFEREDIRALLEDRNGRLWIGTRNGLFRMDSLAAAPVRILADHVGFVEALRQDRYGDVWAGTSLRGVYRWQGARVDSLQTADGLPGNAVRGLFEDAHGGIWIAFDHTGLALLQPAFLASVTPREGLSNPVTLAILGTRDSAMWIATWGGGVNRIAPDGSIQVYRSTDGLSSDQVMSLAEGPDGSVWVGTRAGLNRIRGRRVTQWTEAHGVPDRTISSVFTDRSGRVWIGTNHGLAVLEGNRFRRVPLGTGSQFVLTMLQDRGGALWVGTNGGGLHRLHGERIRTFTTADGLASNAIMSLYEDQHGVLWAATVAGLSRFQAGRFQTLEVKHGLPTAEVLSLNESGEYFWFGSNRGLYRARRQEVIDVLDGRASRLEVTEYSTADGMPSSETNGAFQPSSWRDYQGRLWFPTMAGAVVYDPRRPAAQMQIWPPRVTGVDADYTTPVQPGRLRPGARDLTFNYAAAAYPDGRALQFRYRLAGYDGDWVLAGTQRRAQYTNLPPRAYEFQVQARRPGGPWLSAQAPWRFSITPFFYERTIVRLGALVLVALAGLAAHRARTRTLHQRQAELLTLIYERQQAEARFRSLFENANDVVITLDAEGVITAINAKGAELFGYAAADIRGSQLLDHVTPELQPAARAWLAGALRGEDAARLLELQIVTAARTIVPLEVTWQSDYDRGSRGLQLIGRDIRERIRMEAELRQSQKMEAIGALAGGVAHDFNNLLTAIRGNASFALDTLPETAECREDLAEVIKAADRAAALTQQLLAFGRKQTYHPQYIDVNAAIPELTRMLQRLIGERIELELDLASSLPHVYVDPAQLDQVLINLIVNARDAMPGGGRVTIATRSMRENGATHVVISVTDTGVGIPAEIQPRIFEPFFTTKEAGKGTGLGLATVYGIVHQHHGRIEVRSIPGEGATFSVILPGHRAGASADASRALTPVSVNGREVILLVEDESAVRQVARRVLQKRGYQVLEAENGEVAVELAKATPRIALLLSDLVMPGLSGSELIRRVRSLHPEIKVVLMSGYAAEEIGADAELERIRFIQKPFSADGLAHCVREAIDAN